MRGCKSCKINRRGGGNKYRQGAKVVKSLNKIHEEEGSKKGVLQENEGGNLYWGAKSNKILSKTPYLLER